MNPLLKQFLFIANIILGLLTIGAYLAPYCPPNEQKIVTLLGLAYPALLILNLLFIGIWMVFKPKLALGSLFLLIIGMNAIFRTVGFQSSLNPNSTKKQLLVATFNAQFGKPITLKSGQQKSTLENGYQQYLRKFKTIDVFCTKEQNGFVQGQVEKEINLPYRHSSFNEYLSIYSKYPIINSGTVANFSKNPAIHCIWADIVCHNDTLRIYNAHLEPTTVTGNTPNQIIETIEELPVDISMAIGLLQYYPASAAKRTKQVEKIKNHQKNSPYPVVLSIDLNDTPQSYVYHLVCKNQKDSFLERGNGIGSTFGSTLGNRLLSLRLDYIFADASFDFINHHIHPSIYSDHHLLSATLEW